jgi:hypothetical protein
MNAIKAVLRISALTFLYFTILVLAAAAQDVSGAWEFVHLTGDAGLQAEMYQGGYSTILTQGATHNHVANVTGSTAFTFTNNLAEIYCCNDQVSGTVNTQSNVVTITFSIPANPSIGQAAFQETYTGTFSAGIPLFQIPTTITGTYTSTAPSAYTNGHGNFVATWFPPFSGAAYTGGFDSLDVGSGAQDVPASVKLTTNADGTLSGTVGGIRNGQADFTIAPGLKSSTGLACFAGPLTLKTVTNPLIGSVPGYPPNTSPSFASGVGGYIFAEDSNGVQLWLNWESIRPDGSPAAVGENFDADDVSHQTANNGTRNLLLMYYGVSKGVCDGAGGGDRGFSPEVGKRDRDHREHRRRGDRR